MDFQNRVGHKTGSGWTTWEETNQARKERLLALAMETIDLSKDPYFMKNHLGKFECKLCLTLHNNEGSYLTHTQGKRHQENLKMRAAKDSFDNPIMPLPAVNPSSSFKKFVKIGRPGFKVTKQQNPDSGAYSLLFQVDYPEIADKVLPKHRFMSAYEQKVETPDRGYQYLLFAAEPYETIAFKIQAKDVERTGKDALWTRWDPHTKRFFLQFHFRSDQEVGYIPR